MVTFHQVYKSSLSCLLFFPFLYLIIIIIITITNILLILPHQPSKLQVPPEPIQQFSQ